MQYFHNWTGNRWCFVWTCYLFKLRILYALISILYVLILFPTQFYFRFLFEIGNIIMSFHMKTTGICPQDFAVHLLFVCLYHSIVGMLKLQLKISFNNNIRVTCRDWFQLSLKEGLTVFRDQAWPLDLSYNVSIETSTIIFFHQVNSISIIGRNFQLTWEVAL